MTINNTKSEIKKTMVDIISDIIRKDIVFGEKIQGIKLSTHQLSEELKVSRTPVREAIRRLECEGLIELLPRRGFIVKQYNINKIKEIYVVRKILEVEAISLASQNMTFKELNNIEKISKKLNQELAKKTKDIFLIQEFNREFHFSIYRVSHNQILCEIIGNLWYKTFGLLIKIFSSPHRREEIPIEHEAIITALKMRNKEGVVKALKDHIRETEQILLSYSKSINK